MYNFASETNKYAFYNLHMKLIQIISVTKKVRT
jgi:hypothetical protein